MLAIHCAPETCPRSTPSISGWSPRKEEKTQTATTIPTTTLRVEVLSSSHLLEKEKQDFISFFKKFQKDCLFQYLWTSRWFYWFHNYSFLVLARRVCIPLKQMWRKYKGGKTDLKGFYALEFNTSVFVTPSFLSTESSKVQQKRAQEWRETGGTFWPQNPSGAH